VYWLNSWNKQLLKLLLRFCVSFLIPLKKSQFSKSDCTFEQLLVMKNCLVMIWRKLSYWMNIKCQFVSYEVCEKTVGNLITISCHYRETWNSTILFVMSVRPSGTNTMPQEKFSSKIMSANFFIICRENWGTCTFWKECLSFYIKPDMHLSQYLFYSTRIGKHLKWTF